MLLSALAKGRFLVRCMLGSGQVAVLQSHTRPVGGLSLRPSRDLCIVRSRRWLTALLESCSSAGA